MTEKNSLHGKIKEFEILSKIRELSGNFTKMEIKKFDYSVKQYAFMNLDCIFNVPYT